jgi:hypothetical protein
MSEQTGAGRRDQGQGHENHQAPSVDDPLGLRDDTDYASGDYSDDVEPGPHGAPGPHDESGSFFEGDETPKQGPDEQI